MVLCVGARLIIGEILPQLFIVCDRSVQGLASRKGLPQLSPLLTNLGIAKEQGSPVEVVSSLSVLSALCEDWSQWTGTLRRNMVILTIILVWLTKLLLWAEAEKI